MEALIRAGVNLELSKDDLVSSLMLSHSEEQLVHLREEMFDIAKSTSLVHPRDILVRRLKRAVGPPVFIVKYAKDIAELCYALKHQQLVPRTLLKNGKRSAATFIVSRLGKVSSTSTITPAVSSTPTDPTLQPIPTRCYTSQVTTSAPDVSVLAKLNDDRTNVPLANATPEGEQAILAPTSVIPKECCCISPRDSALIKPCDDQDKKHRADVPADKSLYLTNSVPGMPKEPCSISTHGSSLTQSSNVPTTSSHIQDSDRAIAALSRDLDLRHEVAQLKSELLSLRGSPPTRSRSPSENTESCSLHVKLKAPIPGNINKSVVSEILRCPILSYSIIRQSPAISIRVRVLKSHLLTSLTSYNNQRATVRAWISRTTPSSNPKPAPLNLSTRSALTNYLELSRP